MSAKKMIPAVGYARRSTDMQERSIPDQQAYVEKWAAANGYRVLRWLIDDAISGTSTKGRAAFERLLHEAENGRDFDAVLCYDIPRFSRGGTYETGYYLHRLKLAGVEVLFTAESIPEGDEGELVAGVKSWQAKQYSVRLSRDCIRGTISHIMQKGCAPGGKPPYGYDKQHCTAAGQVLRTFRWLPDGRKQEFGSDGKLIRVLAADETVKKAKSDVVRYIPIDYDPQALPNGRVVVTHRCAHGCGLAVLEPEWFQLWDIRFDGLAAMLASSLALAGRVEAVVPDVLALLGQYFGAGGPLDVFLARRLGNAEAVARVAAAPRLAASAGAVVLVPATLPAGPLPRRETPTLSVAELLVWRDGDSVPDVAAITAALQSIRPPTPAEQWLTVTQCAELLAKDLPSIDLPRAKARVSKAASSGKLTTNGQTRDDRRIERQSFDAWRLQQRDRDLDAEDVDEDGVALRDSRGVHRAAGRKQR